MNGLPPEPAQPLHWTDTRAWTAPPVLHLSSIVFGSALPVSVQDVFSTRSGYVREGGCHCDSTTISLFFSTSLDQCTSMVVATVPQ